MAITPREQLVLGRSDRGVSIDAIAHELKLSRAYVRKVVTYYTVNTMGERRARQAMEAGSHALAQAILTARAEVRAA